MLSNKIRTAIVSTIALAAVSVPGVASAAMLVRSPVTVTQANPVQPGTVVAAKPKEVGSAGVKGWDNQRCEYNSYLAGQAEEEAQAASKAGETKKG